MHKIIVTGSSGKAGRATIADLNAHGYQPYGVDITPSDDPFGPFVVADLTDLGQTVEAFAGADAIVHHAAIPAPGLQSSAVTFQNNIIGSYNVLQAASLLSIDRIVWASSETTLGLPFEREQPAYAPIDEQHPLYPESSYALSKVLGEEMARQFVRWSDAKMTIVALRLSNIMQPHDYERFPSYWQDSALRRWNLWGYIDARDVAQSCRLALTAPLSGAPSYIIAAADTVMNRPSRELMAEEFPDVSVRPQLGEYETLLSIDKARRELGFEPQYSWRDHIDAR